MSQHLKRKKFGSLEDLKAAEDQARLEAARLQAESLVRRFPWMRSKELRETPGVVSTGWGVGDIDALLGEKGSSPPTTPQTQDPALRSGFVALPQPGDQVPQDAPPPPPLPGSLAPLLSPPYPPSLHPTPSSPPQTPPPQLLREDLNNELAVKPEEPNSVNSLSKSYARAPEPKAKTAKASTKQRKHKELASKSVTTKRKHKNNLLADEEGAMVVSDSNSNTKTASAPSGD